MINFTLNYLLLNMKRHTTNPLQKKMDKNVNTSGQVFKRQFIKPTFFMKHSSLQRFQ